MNRAERRRQERLERKRVRVGPGVVESIPGVYDQGRTASLPPKQPGKHRWILTCSYVVTEESVRGEMDGTGESYLDHETRFAMGLGCWDCEQPYPDITPDTICPANEWRS